MLRVSVVFGGSLPIRILARTLSDSARSGSIRKVICLASPNESSFFLPPRLGLGGLLFQACGSGVGTPLGKGLCGRVRFRIRPVFLSNSNRLGRGSKCS